MPKKKEFNERVFIGTVLKDEDPKHQGRYRVHIPELMQHLDAETGLWCKNHSHSGRITMSDNGPNGAYIPVQPGTKVKVRFMENDPNTGAIEQIASDHEVQSLPMNSTDRDTTFQMLRTPDNSIIQVNEDTQDMPPESIHIYHKAYQTTIVIDDAGIHIHTQGNKDLDVDGNYDERIRGDRRSLLEGDDDRTTEGDYKELIEGDVDRTTEGAYKELIEGDVDQRIEGDVKEKIEGDRSFSIDGKMDEKVTGEQKLTSETGYTITIGAQGLIIQSAGVISLKSASAINLDAVGAINLSAGGVINLFGASVLTTPFPPVPGAVAVPLPIVPPVEPEEPEDPEDPEEVIIPERTASTGEPSTGTDAADTPESQSLETSITATEQAVQNSSGNPRELSKLRSDLQKQTDKLAEIKSSPKTSMLKIFNDDAGQPTNDGSESQAGSDPNEYGYFGGKQE